MFSVHVLLFGIICFWHVSHLFQNLNWPCRMSQPEKSERPCRTSLRIFNGVLLWLAPHVVRPMPSSSTLAAKTQKKITRVGLNSSRTLCARLILFPEQLRFYTCLPIMRTMKNQRFNPSLVTRRPSRWNHLIRLIWIFVLGTTQESHIWYNFPCFACRSPFTDAPFSDNIHGGWQSSDLC